MNQLLPLIGIALVYMAIQTAVRIWRTRRLRTCFEGGMAAYKENNFDQALRAFDKCVRMAPTWLHARTFRAISMAKCGQTEEALKEIQLVQELQPREEETWTLIIMFYTLCMPDREEALFGALDAFSRLNPAGAALLLDKPAFLRLLRPEKRQEILARVAAQQDGRS